MIFDLRGFYFMACTCRTFHGLFCLIVEGELSVLSTEAPVDYVCSGKLVNESSLVSFLVLYVVRGTKSLCLNKENDVALSLMYVTD